MKKAHMSFCRYPLVTRMKLSHPIEKCYEPAQERAEAKDKEGGCGLEICFRRGLVYPHREKNQAGAAHEANEK